VLYITGKSATRTSAEKDVKYEKTFAQIYPVILRLSTAADSIPQDLFKPLAFQLIHWFSQNTKYENPETAAILTSILDAVGSNLGPTRDFGISCAIEFFNSSMRSGKLNVSLGLVDLTFREMVHW
jgi:hypothetical protein